MHQFLKFIFGIKLYMFRTVPLFIIRGFSLYTQQLYMSYRFVELASKIRTERPDSGRLEGSLHCRKRLPIFPVCIYTWIAPVLLMPDKNYYEFWGTVGFFPWCFRVFVYLFHDSSLKPAAHWFGNTGLVSRLLRGAAPPLSHTSSWFGA